MPTTASINRNLLRYSSNYRRSRLYRTRGRWHGADDGCAEVSDLWGQSQRTEADLDVSQAQAEAKQRLLVEQKQHQDALNSDTVAIDFAHQADSKGAPANSHRCAR